MYIMLCEWDIGQEYVVFRSKESAYEWLAQNLVIKEILAEYESIQELIDNDLISLNEVEVI